MRGHACDFLPFPTALAEPRVHSCPCPHLRLYFPSCRTAMSLYVGYGRHPVSGRGGVDDSGRRKPLPPHRSYILENEDKERPAMLTISFVHHSLDDYWEHTPVQVKVQLRKGSKNSQVHRHEAVS